MLNPFTPNSLSAFFLKLPVKVNKSIIDMLLNFAFFEQIVEGNFEFLEDDEVQVQIIDANLFVGVSFNNSRLCCTHLSSSKKTSGATLSINTIDALDLLEQNVDPDTLFFQRKLKITGNTELAHQTKNTIDTLDHEQIPQFILRLTRIYKKTILQK